MLKLRRVFTMTVNNHSKQQENSIPLHLTHYKRCFSITITFGLMAKPFSFDVGFDNHFNHTVY